MKSKFNLHQLFFAVFWAFYLENLHKSLRDHYHKGLTDTILHSKNDFSLEWKQERLINYNEEFFPNEFLKVSRSKGYKRKARRIIMLKISVKICDAYYAWLFHIFFNFQITHSREKKSLTCGLKNIPHIFVI